MCQKVLLITEGDSESIDAAIMWRFAAPGENIIKMKGRRLLVEELSACRAARGNAADPYP